MICLFDFLPCLQDDLQSSACAKVCAPREIQKTRLRDGEFVAWSTGHSMSFFCIRVSQLHSLTPITTLYLDRTSKDVSTANVLCYAAQRLDEFHRMSGRKAVSSGELHVPTDARLRGSKTVLSHLRSLETAQQELPPVEYPGLYELARS